MSEASTNKSRETNALSSRSGRQVVRHALKSSAIDPATLAVLQQLYHYHPSRYRHTENGASARVTLSDLSQDECEDERRLFVFNDDEDFVGCAAKQSIYAMSMVLEELEKKTPNAEFNNTPLYSWGCSLLKRRFDQKTATESVESAVFEIIKTIKAKSEETNFLEWKAISIDCDD